MSEKYFSQPSVMSALARFSQVPSAEIERSRFDRSHGYKTSFDAGKLIPVFLDEVLPGDTFTLHATGFTRLSTPLKPIMDNIDQDIHFFFVPNRLVWEHWQEFMGERKNPDDDPNDFSVPQTPYDPDPVSGQGLVSDYLGLPKFTLGAGVAPNVSALPFRAIALIWNEWYRDENLQDRIPIDTGDGPDDWSTMACPPRGKRKDYFTGALPFAQKGDPVLLPLGGFAPVVTQSALRDVQGWPDMKYHKTTDNADIGTGILVSSGGSAFRADGTLGANQAPVAPANLYADLEEATATTINDLRTAFQIQRLLERDARGGTRYIELILSHFGVRSDDARLQRPEYLGGGTNRVNINPVASTYASPDQPQGQLAAVGTSVPRGGFSKSFTEHGFVIGFISVRADLTYQRGIERMFSRKTRYEYYWPALAHLGEQAILNKEIYAQGLPADDMVFGYQERYAEYRFKPSRITGKMASVDPQSLDVWHLSQDFVTLPGLNEAFIVENPPMDRVVAIPSEPIFIGDFWFSFMCDRPMPVYSVPGLIDHF